VCLFSNICLVYEQKPSVNHRKTQGIRDKLKGFGFSTQPTPTGSGSLHTPNQAFFTDFMDSQFLVEISS